MSTLGYAQCLITAQADGAPNTTGALASLLPTPAVYTLPSNFFYIGKQLIIKAQGRISTAVTTPGNLAFAVLFGAVSVFTPAVIAGNALVQTNTSWDLEIVLTCRAIGSGTSANMMGQGRWTSRASLNQPIPGTTIGVLTVLLPDTAPAVGTGFDSTATQKVDLQFSNSVATGSCTLHQYSLWDVN
jgi:hypothetical protein